MLFENKKATVSASSSNTTKKGRKSDKRRLRRFTDKMLNIFPNDTFQFLLSFLVFIFGIVVIIFAIIAARQGNSSLMEAILGALAGCIATLVSIVIYILRKGESSRQRKESQSLTDGESEEEDQEI